MPGNPEYVVAERAAGQQTNSPTQHAFALDDSGRSVIAQPGTHTIPSLTGRKVTLVVDQSWSMAAHREELLATLHKAVQYMAGNTVNVLLATTKGHAHGAALRRWPI